MEVNIEKYRGLLSQCSWKDIDFEEGDITNEGNEKLIVTIHGISIPQRIINLEAQNTRLNKIQLHMFICDDLQRLGIGTKIYNAFIHIFGGVYSGFGRVLNPDAIYSIYSKLNKEPDITVQYVLGINGKPIGIEAFLSNKNEA